ncbi:MAG TPA: gephyrin-like molybdotransferase Glp [Acidimicrobiales bacterium]|nr:gephyrin-like molybdotransferase Glp [Acidimicrobiales bacterium]
MITVAEARQFVLSSCRRLSPVQIETADALGLVLAEAVRSESPVPPFANSSMDGFALRSQNVKQSPARLRVVGEVMAGDDPGPLTVGQGEAVRIMTGAVIPPGADAVCMVEHTRADNGWVVIEEAVRPGNNIRLAGEDVASGAEVFASGVRLGPAHIGVLASIGVDRVTVYPRPRVGVASTGDELVTAAGPLPPGKIRDSNRASLLARLRADGFVGVDLGLVPDEPAALARTLQDAVQSCNAVLTSGGVSVGDRDFVKLVLEELGGQHARWLQVAVRPGKPFAFSTLPPDGAAVFGLPGNPVSALVSYEVFARPSLRLMAGHANLDRPRLAALAEVGLPREPDGRLHLARVHAFTRPDGTLAVRPSGGQGSHQLRSLAGANALAFLPDGPGVVAGEPVEVIVLDPDELAPGDD